MKDNRIEDRMDGSLGVYLFNTEHGKSIGVKILENRCVEMLEKGIPFNEMDAIIGQYGLKLGVKLEILVQNDGEE